MNLKEPLYIYSIYKYKSITKAAKELCITQPALSKFLINLESRIGIQIFDKSNNNYIPTYYGDVYIKYAKRILEINKLWEEEESDILHSGKGEFSISIPIFRSSVLLTKILPEYMKEFPNVTVLVQEETYKLNYNSLDFEQFDIVLYNPVKFIDTYNYEFLYKEDTVAVGSISNKIIHSAIENNLKVIDFSKFINTTFILPSEFVTTGVKLKNLFIKYGLEPKVKMRTRSSELAISCVVDTNYITFCPRSYAVEYSKKYPIIYYGIGEYTELYCVYKIGKLITPYMRKFIDNIKKYYASIN